MNFTDQKLHESIKHWLMELGVSQMNRGRNYYRCYTGDSEPLDVRVRRRHVSYRPDVVWEAGSQSVVFELAFTDGWRAIAGEIILAALSRKVAKVFIITDYEDTEVSDMVSIFDDWVRDKDLLKWGAEHIAVAGMEDAKRKIRRRLRQGDYIW
ncbi:MAG: hypothetical protein ABSA97_03540 [Verrucomicrobiia bacterium]